MILKTFAQHFCLTLFNIVDDILIIFCINSSTRAYQIFVESIEENPNSVPLTLPEIYGNHSLNKSKDHIYIAAEFEKTLPDTFILGEEKWEGPHYNARLKPLTKYRIYIRALANSYINKVS